MSTNNLVKSKVISVRLPEPFIKELKSYCNCNDVSVSDVMKRGFASGGTIGLFEAPDPDANLTQFLTSVGGGSLMGLLVYKGVYGTLKEKFTELSETELEIYSGVSAVAIALLSGYGISKLLQSIK